MRILNVASGIQATKDLFENRNSKEGFLLLNNIAQFLAAVSATFRHASAPSLNLIACIAASNKIENDYKKGKVDAGDLIAFGGNLAGLAIDVVAETGAPIPPHFKVASVVLAVGGLAYSNREYLAEKLRRIGNGDFEMKELIQDAKACMNKLVAENSQVPNQGATKLAEAAKAPSATMANLGGFKHTPKEGVQFAQKSSLSPSEMTRELIAKIQAGEANTQQSAKEMPQVADLNSDYYTKRNKFGFTQAMLDEANQMPQSQMNGRSV